MSLLWKEKVSPWGLGPGLGRYVQVEPTANILTVKCFLMILNHHRFPVGWLWTNSPFGLSGFNSYKVEMTQTAILFLHLLLFKQAFSHEIWKITVGTTVNFSLILYGGDGMEEKRKTGRKLRTQFIFLHWVREGALWGGVLRLSTFRILNKCVFHFLFLALLWYFEGDWFFFPS